MTKRNVQVGAALILAAGLGAIAVAMLAAELGIGRRPEMFGPKRIALLVAGGVTAAIGTLLLARARTVAGVLGPALERAPAFMRNYAFALVVAGASVALVGTLGTSSCAPATPCSSARELGGSLVTIAGAQLLMLGLLAHAYASFLAPRERRSRPWAWEGYSSALREGLALAAVALLAGAAVTLALTDRWLPDGLGAGLAGTRVIGVLGIAMATQLVISLALVAAGGASIALAERVRAGESSSALRSGAGWLRSPPGIAALLTVAFVAISWWWLATETRALQLDAVRHLQSAFFTFGELQRGELVAALSAGGQPGETPLVHLVGGITMLFSGGLGVEWPTLALNVVFVPLLALGTYGAASVAWGDRRAGLLAVMFMFAAPMVMSMFRVFMIDAPLAAVTALAVWLILASDRFGRRSYTIAAGIAVGAGVMTKTIFPFYVAGLLAVVLLRGGWRNWRNLAWVAVPAAVIAVPWMVMNWTELWPHITAHLEATGGWYVPGYEFAPRWSVDNFTYYAWSIVNHQLLVPLTALVLIGIAVATKDVLREWRDRANYAPELLAGLVGGYFLTSLLPLDDSRYILPLIVYAAVLGTGWVLRLGQGPRAVVMAVLAVILVANTAAQNFGAGKTLAVALVEEPDPAALARNGEGSLVFLEPAGFNALGRPDGKAKTREIIDSARTQGIQRVAALPGGGGMFQHVGFHVNAADIPGVEDHERLGPNEMAIKLVDPGGPKPEGEPCTRWRSGVESYVYRGDSRRLPAEAYEPWCPLRDR